MRRRVCAVGVGIAILGLVVKARADGIPDHPAVEGEAVAKVDLAPGDGPDHARGWLSVDWSVMGTRPLPPGTWLVRAHLPASAEAVELPACAGRRRAWIDGVEAGPAPGPQVLSLRRRGDAHDHVVVMAVTVSDYERRIACGGALRAGTRVTTRYGLGVLEFESPRAERGGGHAVVFLPPNHDRAKPAALLVGAHPWNGNIWTYAAYAELLREAAAKDVVLLMPSGLGNSLYTADAEDEVLAAVDALSSRVAIDPRRVSLWGASMGGAGATTIGFHHPDHFAAVTSFFGDSKYDLSTYVRPILHDETGAHLVNALDVVDNARHLPVWLIHGTDDRISPIAQSELLARELTRNGFRVRFDRLQGRGHEGAIVARYASELVDLASTARAPDVVPHVTYCSVRATDTSAYGVRFIRAASRGDACLDVERRGDEVHVLRAIGVTRIDLARGALGVAPSESPPIVREPEVTAEVGWDPLAPAEH